MSKESIVVFDEAHNIGQFLPFLYLSVSKLMVDNVCIESLSVDLTRPMLESAARSVNKIGDKIEEFVGPFAFFLLALTNRIKRTDAEKLQNEYEKLVSGLQEANEHREDEDMLANPGWSCSPSSGLPSYSSAI